MKDAVNTSIVVPCYRSKATLPDLVAELSKTLDARGGRYEIILVNDASPDDTWGTIEKLAAQYPAVVGLDMQYNVGQFKATLCGLEHARGKVVVTMDDDLQHPPKELPKLLDRLEAHPNIDCVIGAYAKKQHSRLRRLGTAWYAKLSEHLYGKPPQLEMTSFRAMRRNLVNAMVQFRTSRPFLETLILKSTSPRRVLNVEVEHHPRRAGRSGYNYRRLARIVMDNVVGNSALPFHALASLGGVALTLSVLIAGGWTLAWMCGLAVAASGFGTAALAVLATSLGGAVLVGLGLVGEYLHRGIQENTGPARFVVRQSVQGAVAPTPAVEPLFVDHPLAGISPMTDSDPLAVSFAEA